jgi:Acyl-CoA dehydrogenases
MIADMAMKLEAARQLTYAAAAKSERAMAGEKIDDLTFFSSACKCLASDVAMSVTTDAVQLARRLRLRQRLPGRADDA